jgi:hypothetical protein
MRQEMLGGEVVERRQQLAPHQISGRPKNQKQAGLDWRSRRAASLF